MASILDRARLAVTRVTGAETAPAKVPAAPAVKPRRSFHAVEIVAGDDCCELVRRYTGKRYLSAEAPAVPLNGCDAAECMCRYVHHADRRKRQRRTSDLAVTVDEYGGSERRSGGKRGRRATD
jgi:hypothetical protein